MQHDNTHFLCKNVVAGVQLQDPLPTIHYTSLAALKSEALMMSTYTLTSVFNQQITPRQRLKSSLPNRF